MTLNELGISPQAIAILESTGITTAEQLEGYTKTDLEDIRGIGPVTAQDILDALAAIASQPNPAPESQSNTAAIAQAIINTGNAEAVENLIESVQWAIAAFQGLPLENLGANLAAILRKKSGVGGILEP